MEVHISGTSSNNHLHDYIEHQLGQLHVVIKKSKYKVLLSYHDWYSDIVVVHNLYTFGISEICVNLFFLNMASLI